MDGDVLLVDSERATGEYTRQLLAIDGFKTTLVTSSREALAAIEKAPFAIVLVSLSGLAPQFARISAACRDHAPGAAMVAIADRTALHNALQAVRDGATDFVTRPFDPAELSFRLQRVLELRRRREDRSRVARPPRSASADTFQGIIGKNAKMQRVYQLIENVAPADTTVLILGETGTGKELVARALHNLSPRRRKAFVSVNCAAVPETLLESELFGHEKGSFTGAVRRNIGRFEEANGGTIFLDEIGDMPVAVQVKLLRVLQERQIRRVGGDSPVDVDIRVVLATNRDLEKMVSAGTFREDLFYRINVVPVRLPALRERLDDLPVLVDFFVQKYRSRTNSEVMGFSPRAMDQLARAAWPGNVRELENFVERSLILEHASTMIDHVDVAESGKGGASAAVAQVARPNRAADRIVAVGVGEDLSHVDTEVSMKELIAVTTERIEQSYLRAVLHKYRGNIKRSYEHAGISRRGFFEKMRQYGIRKEEFK